MTPFCSDFSIFKILDVYCSFNFRHCILFYFIYQVVSSSRHVHKEDSEISNFCSKFGAPGDLALQHHLVWINVVEVGAFRQQEHSLLGEKSLLLVQDSLTDDQMTLDESVIFVLVGLLFQPEWK